MTSRDEIWWDRLLTEKGGRLTRTTDLRRAPIFADQIELRGQKLIWTTSKPRKIEGSRPGNKVILDGAIARGWILRRKDAEREGRSILDEFVKLQQADGKKILAFAKRWGVLDLCWHGVPRQHESLEDLPIKLPGQLALWPLEFRSHIALYRCLSVRREPLESWRFFATQAAALLRIAAEIREGRFCDQHNWALVLNDGWSPQPSIKAHRACLYDALDGWLRLGKIGVGIDHGSETLKWRGADLFGELAVQLVLASFGKDGRVLCSICGEEYAPRKRVEKGVVHICPAENCQRAANAARQRRSRERKKNPDQPSENRTLPHRGPFRGRTDDPFFS